MWSTLFLFALAASSALATPLAEAVPQARESVPDYHAIRSPLHLTRRRESGYQPRHLRPEEFVVVPADEPATKVKRDGVEAPDVGQMASFTAENPEPTRLGTGYKFLSNTNVQIDKQNVDNVAPPTTDQGSSAVCPSHRI